MWIGIRPYLCLVWSTLIMSRSFNLCNTLGIALSPWPKPSPSESTSFVVCSILNRFCVQRLVYSWSQILWFPNVSPSWSWSGSWILSKVNSNAVNFSCEFHMSNQDQVFFTTCLWASCLWLSQVPCKNSKASHWPASNIWGDSFWMSAACAWWVFLPSSSWLHVLQVMKMQYI